MEPISKKIALKKAVNQLADWLKVPRAKVRYGENNDEHITFGIGNHLFVIQFKATSSTAQIYSIVRSLKELKIRHGKDPIPIVAVPFMGEAGTDICQKRRGIMVGLIRKR